MRSKSLVLMIWAIVFLCFVVGFLLFDTSGLGLGTGPITPTTAVAKVGGTEVSWVNWQNLATNLSAQQERQLGRSLTLEERQQMEDQAFERLVGDLLLEQEYRRRGIFVTDDEVREAAQQAPPPELMQNPELQTNGQFDMEKYRRLLNSAAARQQGLLIQLEGYYRSEVPKAKLFDQLAGDVYVSDDKLWSTYKDQYDSTQVSFVAFDAAGVADSAVTVPDGEIRSFYDRNKEALERTGRSVLSLIVIPRTITAADTQATRARALALREEILGGASFDDVARRESADTVSAPSGGSLGTTTAETFVDAFAVAARALPVGQISEPVLSPFGYHLIRKEAQKGDSLTLRHILLRVTQSDSAATLTDRRADSLSRMTAGATSRAQFDSAARVLGITPEQVTAFEGQPVISSSGKMVPSVSAWAFTGSREGETSDLFDSEELYALARLDTLVEGGVPRLQDARADIVNILIRRKKAESLLPRAREFLATVQGTDLETAAGARDMIVQKSDLFTRSMFVPGMGRFNEAIGAAFSLPVGSVSEPVVTDQGVFVLRVDRRISADRAAWEAQKDQQRTEAINAIRQLRVRTFLSELRKSAKVTDNRKKLNAAARAQAAIE
ncbi:MAG: peptidylprolyl isomerase [Gemmatimonadota bacterium]